MTTPFALFRRQASAAPVVPRLLSRSQNRALTSARRLARLMDAQWRVGPLRFGLETVTDCVPGIGDLVSLGVSLYQLGVASQLGVPRRRRLRMVVNVGVDALVGGIPVLGDLADTLFKAHVRNQRIIDDYIGSEQRAA
jgi:Domain of unknown function (DUF4112)